MKATFLLILGFVFHAQSAVFVTPVNSCLALNGHRETILQGTLQFTVTSSSISWVHTNNGHNTPPVIRIPKGEVIKRVESNSQSSFVFVATNYRKLIYDSRTGALVTEVGFVGDENSTRDRSSIKATTLGVWSPNGQSLVSFNLNKEQGGLYLRLFSTRTRNTIDGESLGNSPPYTGQPVSVIWSSDSRYFGVAREGRSDGLYYLVLFDAREGTFLNSKNKKMPIGSAFGSLKEIEVFMEGLRF